MRPRPILFRLITPTLVTCLVTLVAVLIAVPAGARVTAGVVGCGAVLFLAAWAGLLLQKRWVNPLQELSETSGRLAGGDWTARATLADTSELRELGGQVNLLAGQAQRQLSDLEHRRADLRALVDALPDPILQTDSSQSIVLLNTPAARLLQVEPEEALGKRLLSVVVDQAILGLIEPLVSDPTSANAYTREIRLIRNGQRVLYHAVATRTRGGGVLLVLRNVTAMVSTVQMKTDFVANASHELRTPIAAIKIAFETLAEVYQDDPEQAERCVQIIGGHLRRLEEMLTDLLDLSRVESTEIKPHIAPVEAEEVFAAVRGTMMTAAREKGVQLEFKSTQQPFRFESDRRLLNLILRNLVENSIKFTPPGGRVSVRIQPVDSEADGARAAVLMEVADTGIGIPPQHLERVFERFYQVDAARSGSAGRGTGLGLAIVKHAVHALGGTVDLDSTEGRGTTVRCTFPHIERPVEVTPSGAEANDQAIGG
jgi:two-component system phosphate regulon sensor histidine kinase PhoR